MLVSFDSLARQCRKGFPHVHECFVLSTESREQFGHRKEIRVLKFRALAPLCSDEGLINARISVVWTNYLINSVDTTKHLSPLPTDLAPLFFLGESVKTFGFGHFLGRYFG